MEKISNKKIIITALIILTVILLIYISYRIKGTINSSSYIENITEATWNEEDVIDITFEDSKITGNVTINDNTILITQGGTYRLTGTSENASVNINTKDEVTLILDNLDLTNQSGPAILIENAEITNIVLNENTSNKLSDGNNSNEEYDAVIYSKDDLTISGTGNLEITTNFENGIKCTDDLVIFNGNIIVNSNTNGIIGKDSVTIKSGNITIKSGGDAIKSNNDEEAEKGNITIEDANITITSQEDGIQAEQNLTINGGTFNITTNNGSSTLSGKTGWENTTTTSSEESAKAIKASNIIINNGQFTINSKDDGIHSNGNLKIENGTFTIKSSDDGIHGDALVEINDGTLDITASEGIEGTYVKINGGSITINAADDGINAGKKSNEYTPTIEINGGSITIKMASGDTDGLDSNGNLYINGGTIDITGQSPFDYDGEAKYTGGKMIVNGVETTEITNQMMGPVQGQMQNGTKGNMQGGQPNPGMQRR